MSVRRSIRRQSSISMNARKSSNMLLAAVKQQTGRLSQSLCITKPALTRSCGISRSQPTTWRLSSTTSTSTLKLPRHSANIETIWMNLALTCIKNSCSPFITSSFVPSTRRSGSMLFPCLLPKLLYASPEKYATNYFYLVKKCSTRIWGRSIKHGLTPPYCKSYPNVMRS